MPRSPRFEVFKMRRLRIDQQSGRGREGRAFRRIRQAGKAERTTDANRASENSCCEFWQANQLARAAAEDGATGGDSGSVQLGWSLAETPVPVMLKPFHLDEMARLIEGFEPQDSSSSSG